MVVTLPLLEDGLKPLLLGFGVATAAIAKIVSFISEPSFRDSPSTLSLVESSSKLKRVLLALESNVEQFFIIHNYSNS